MESFDLSVSSESSLCATLLLFQVICLIFSHDVTLYIIKTSVLLPMEVVKWLSNTEVENFILEKDMEDGKIEMFLSVSLEVLEWA